MNEVRVEHGVWLNMCRVVRWAWLLSGGWVQEYVCALRATRCADRLGHRWAIDATLRRKQ